MDEITYKFTGKNLNEIANKMLLFLNCIKGVNLVNVKDSEIDSERLLQSEQSGVHEGTSGYPESPCENPGKL